MAKNTGILFTAIIALFLGGCVGYKVNTSKEVIGTYRKVSVGALHACALTSTGSVVCWGADQYGSTEPPSGEFTDIDTGYGCSCGIRMGGEVECWGRCLHHPDGKFRKVSVGYKFSCGITNEGVVDCWSGGVLPVDFSFRHKGSPFVDVVVGSNQVCAITSEKAPYCVGAHVPGCFSPPNSRFKQIDMIPLIESGLVACGVTDSNTIECWGYGQWSDEKKETVPSDDSENIDISGNSYVVLDRDIVETRKALTAFKDSENYGMMGDGAKSFGAALGGLLRILMPPEPRWKNRVNGWKLDQPPVGKFLQVAVSFSNVIAIKEDGNLVSWGTGYESGAVPHGRFRQISSGQHAACGIRVDDQLVCWGSSLGGINSPP